MAHGFLEEEEVEVVVEEEVAAATVVVVGVVVVKVDKMKYQKYITVMQMAMGVTASNKDCLPTKRQLWWVERRRKRRSVDVWESVKGSGVFS